MPTSRTQSNCRYPVRCYFNALLLLPFLTLQSFGVHPALDHSAQAGSSPLVSFDRHGLLDKASALSQRLAAQSSMLVATNPWHRLVNEQLAYALNSYTSGELSATGAKAESSGLEIRRRLKMLDDLDELLTFIQANDELPGSTQFSVETLGVGSSAAFSQSYLLPNNLPPGAVIVIGSHEEQLFNFQTTNPQASNFVSISTSGVASFQLEAYALTRGFGERKTTKIYPAMRVTDGELTRGETVTVSYQNFQVPKIAQTHFTLPLYVLNPSLALPYAVPTTGIRLKADKGTLLRATAPSIVRQNQDFEITAELIDRYGNLSSSETPSLDLLVNGVFQQRLEKSDDAVRSISIRLDKLGITQLEMRSGGGGIRAFVNPVDVVRQSEYQLHWVDLHQRTMAGQGLYTNGDITRQQQNLDLSLITNQTLNMSQQDLDAQAPAGGIIGFELDRDLRHGGNEVVLATDLVPFSSHKDRILAFEDAADVILMAVPDVPTDVRAFNPRSGRLVEVISNNTAFEPFGIRHALQGNRIGFTGTSGAKDSQLNTPTFKGLTAVWVKPEETLFEALLESRTYVTSGAKILLEVEVNGGLPGSRVQHNQSREITGRVAGTNGIFAVELVKNGLVIGRIAYGSQSHNSKQLSSDESSGTDAEKVSLASESVPEPEQQLRVSFYSSSRSALDQIDYPRNGREWIGYLKFTGGNIQGVSAPGFGTSARQGVAINPRQDARIDFITWTRGQASSYLVDADFTDDNAVIELNLKGGQEDHMVAPMLRRSASFQSSRQLLTVAELRRGPVERTIEVEGYRDTVGFELIDKDLPTEQTFRFHEGIIQKASQVEDSQLLGPQVKIKTTGNAKNLKAGDFYYIRVIQVDDHIALSSPVWVGGFDVYR